MALLNNETSFIAAIIAPKVCSNYAYIMTPYSTDYNPNPNSNPNPNPK